MIQREEGHECVHIQSDYELRCDNSKEGKKKVLTDWCNAKFKSEWWVKTIKLLNVNFKIDFLF